MSFRELKNWVSSRTWVKNRIQGVCLWYLLFLMTPARKHSFQEVAKFSGLNKSQFSRALQNHLGASVYTLDQLSKREAKRLAPLVKHLAKGALPWKTGLLIDSTLHQRSTLHTENAKRFNHGKGFVIGHQWTNIALFINEMIIPLPPIAFHSKKYCRKNNLKYKTENESVVEYLTQLNLQDYMGDHNPDEVVVLADSGYDDKKIENVIIQKGWRFIIAIKKTRSVKTEKQSCNSPKSKGWSHVAALFKDHRRTPWKTVRIFTDSPKRKRMDFRIRQIIGHLRYVGKAQLICSEFKKNTGGRIKYLACNDLKAKARQILIGYRLRWGIGVSSQGHIAQLVKVRPGIKDPNPVAWEVPWRESKMVKPSDRLFRTGMMQRLRLHRAVNADVASLHAIPVAETVDNARRQQGPTETGLIRRLSPAGYQRWHEAKGYVSTGEALGIRRRNLVEEAAPITASGKWGRRCQGGGLGRSTVDRCAAKRTGRKGPRPLNAPFVCREAGAR
jgi:hypothetical protein